MHVRPAVKRKTFAVTIHFTEDEREQLSKVVGSRPYAPVCHDLVMDSLQRQASLAERLCLQEIVATRQEQRILMRAVLAGLRQLCQKPPATDQDVSETAFKIDSQKEALAERMLHQAVQR